MKVYELMNELANMDAGLEVEVTLDISKEKFMSIEDMRKFNCDIKGVYEEEEWNIGYVTLKVEREE